MNTWLFWINNKQVFFSLLNREIVLFNHDTMHAIKIEKQQFSFCLIVKQVQLGKLLTSFPYFRLCKVYNVLFFFSRWYTFDIQVWKYDVMLDFPLCRSRIVVASAVKCLSYFFIHKRERRLTLSQRSNLDQLDFEWSSKLFNLRNWSSY